MSGNEWEILAPAGQSDSLRAAVHAGADSVYLGLQRFNARQNAKNFDPEQLTKGIKYCKLNGTKIYLTLNTLVFDKEWDALQQAVQQACALGVDAVIVQDLGVARLVREAAPDLRLHGSTQMSVHTPRGAQQLKELGFSRVILARELSLPEIQEISSVGIELEVFVHGALCMSVSGQCYLSAMLGGRSANRGSCAQPCRLPFSAGRAGACDLSLKDLSALDRLAELKQAGVCCLKIEGRMKRPEYVASAVEACKIAAEGGQPDLQGLQSVFSRSGFTNGYIDGERGPQMFGVRSKEDVTAASAKLLKSIAHRFEQPAQHLPLEMELTVRQGTPCRLTVSDGQGCQVLIEGPRPEPSIRFDLEADRAKQSLQKLGGTPYILERFSAAIDPGLTLSAAELNQLRRAAVERMNELRSRLELVSYRQPKPLPRAASQTLTGLRAEFARYEQIPWALTDGLEWIGLDLDEMIRHSERLAPYRDRLAILPPRGMFGTEQAVEKKLQLLAGQGYQHLVAQNLAHLQWGKQLGFAVHGGFSLNIANSQAEQQAKELGLEDVVVSPELTLSQIAQLHGPLPRGCLVAGHLPLMLTRNCPLCNERTCQDCDRQGELTDRKGYHFPVRCAHGTRELFNPQLLWMADRMDELKNVSFGVLRFGMESPEETMRLLQDFIQKVKYTENITRGLYYRGVI